MRRVRREERWKGKRRERIKKEEAGREKRGRGNEEEEKMRTGE